MSGCVNEHTSGMEMLQKIRMKGFNNKPLPMIHRFECKECGSAIEMVTMEYKCPECNMVYAVTPCSAMDVNNVKPAGINV